jgi:hypothetical protein
MECPVCDCPRLLEKTEQRRSRKRNRLLGMGLRAAQRLQFWIPGILGANNAQRRMLPVKYIP